MHAQSVSVRQEGSISLNMCANVRHAAMLQAPESGRTRNFANPVTCPTSKLFLVFGRAGPTVLSEPAVPCAQSDCIDRTGTQPAPSRDRDRDTGLPGSWPKQASQALSLPGRYTSRERMGKETPLRLCTQNGRHEPYGCWDDAYEVLRKPVLVDRHTPRELRALWQQIALKLLTVEQSRTDPYPISSDLVFIPKLLLWHPPGKEKARDRPTASSRHISESLPGRVVISN